MKATYESNQNIAQSSATLRYAPRVSTQKKRVPRVVAGSWTLSVPFVDCAYSSGGLAPVSLARAHWSRWCSKRDYNCVYTRSTLVHRERRVNKKYKGPAGVWKTRTRTHTRSPSTPGDTLVERPV
ncbi:hypothetical protein MRX96_037364 [Rhipicephalus microplus]